MNASGNLNCDVELCNALCCRNCAVLTEEEAAALVASAKREYNVELDPKKYFRRAKGEHGTYFAVKMIRGWCIFLNKEKRCRIYRSRPTLCELYPAIDIDAVDKSCLNVRNNKFSKEVLVKLKQRYAAEVDERIKIEQRFSFI